jgi:hypothetical protein
MKALSGNHIRIQPKTPDAYRTIVKALDEKNRSFTPINPKMNVAETSTEKYDPAEIKYEIENLGHTVTNIYNIKQTKIKLPLPVFFVDLKPAPNNKDIFQIEYLQQCKITFEPPKQKKGHCTMCQLSTLRAHKELLSPHTEMREMRWYPSDKSMPPQGMLQQCLLRPLWW